MSTIIHKTHPIASNTFRTIIMLSAWGFALVITSCLCLWLGYLLDEWLGTAPKFMLGLFFLAIIGCFIEIYQEALGIITRHETYISKVHRGNTYKSDAPSYALPWYADHRKQR